MTVSIMQALVGREIVLCCGPGGVGKTTSSATIAVAAARAGKRVLVLTIDPARRLADALGIQLSDSMVPKRVELEGVAGELSALMLDATKTMDDLVRRLAPNERAAERILGNLIYRQISRALSGGLEYTAVEKLFDLRDRFSFDLIVVDTPPSKNVLDFIEAPHYLAGFFDDRVIKWFLLLDPNTPPRGLGAAVLRRTGAVVWDVLGRVFGRAFLADISEFMQAIEAIAARLRQRAEAIAELLRSDRALFLIVSSTDPLVVEDAAFLRREIAARGIPFGGFIMNRVHVPSGVVDLGHVEERLKRLGEPGLADAVVNVCREEDVQAASDAAAIATLRTRTGWQGFLAALPRQAGDVHDLAALQRLAAHLSQAPVG